jgi:hypothetical protein
LVGIVLMRLLTYGLPLCRLPVLLPPENAGAYTHTELLVLHIRLDITHICALSVCVSDWNGGWCEVGWCSVLSAVSGARKAQTVAATKIQLGWPDLFTRNGLGGTSAGCTHTGCVHQIFGETSAMQYEDAVVATTLRSRRSGVRC